MSPPAYSHMYCILTDSLQVQEEHCDPPRSGPAAAAVVGMGIRPRRGRVQQEGRPGALRVFSLTVWRGDRAGLRSLFPLGKWRTFLNPT